MPVALRRPLPRIINPPLPTSPATITTGLPADSFFAAVGEHEWRQLQLITGARRAVLSASAAKARLGSTFAAMALGADTQAARASSSAVAAAAAAAAPAAAAPAPPAAEGQPLAAQLAVLPGGEEPAAPAPGAAEAATAWAVQFAEGLLLQRHIHAVLSEASRRAGPMHGAEEAPVPLSHLLMADWVIQNVDDPSLMPELSRLAAM
jgi:hypothetical protein